MMAAPARKNARYVCCVDTAGHVSAGAMDGAIDEFANVLERITRKQGHALLAALDAVPA